MKFLCEHHRKQLESLPLEAEECWEQWMQSGAKAMTAGEWQLALRYVGSAFEASELMLAQPDLYIDSDELSNADRFMISGHYLAECLHRIGRNDAERHYLMRVHQRLMNLASDESVGSYQRISVLKNIKVSIALLKRHFERCGESEPVQYILRAAEALTLSMRRCVAH